MKMELRSRALDKLYKRRDRIEMPDFQREEVWEDDKKRLLIDSILRGWHLPKFYFRKTGDGTWECVDGQQRLTTIWEFYDNKLELDDATAKKYGGKTYRDLEEDFSDRTATGFAAALEGSSPFVLQANRKVFSCRVCSRPL